MAVITKQEKSNNQTGFDYDNLFEQALEIAIEDGSIDAITQTRFEMAKAKIVPTLKKLNSRLKSKEETDNMLAEQKINKRGYVVHTVAVADDHTRKRIQDAITKVFDVVRKKNPEILPSGKRGVKRLKVENHKEMVKKAIDKIVDNNMKMEFDGTEIPVNLNLQINYSQNGKKKSMSLMKFVQELERQERQERQEKE